HSHWMYEKMKADIAYAVQHQHRAEENGAFRSPRQCVGSGTTEDTAMIFILEPANRMMKRAAHDALHAGFSHAESRFAVGAQPQPRVVMYGNHCIQYT
ncbi:MAG TPA: hypothetical protein VJ521_01395, partial [Acidobacteriota bacterium]|nr:hypothetical protein [Acidobacteriota bacterium]